MAKGSNTPVAASRVRVVLGWSTPADVDASALLLTRRRQGAGRRRLRLLQPAGEPGRVGHPPRQDPGRDRVLRRGRRRPDQGRRPPSSASSSRRPSTGRRSGRSRACTCGCSTPTPTPSWPASTSPTPPPRPRSSSASSTCAAGTGSSVPSDRGTRPGWPAWRATSASASTTPRRRRLQPWRRHRPRPRPSPAPAPSTSLNLTPPGGTSLNLQPPAPIQPLQPIQPVQPVAPAAAPAPAGPPISLKKQQLVILEKQAATTAPQLVNLTKQAAVAWRSGGSASTPPGSRCASTSPARCTATSVRARCSSSSSGCWRWRCASTTTARSTCFLFGPRARMPPAREPGQHSGLRAASCCSSTGSRRATYYAKAMGLVRQHYFGNSGVPRSHAADGHAAGLRACS